jgi:cytochrome b pre-mRNA-processing protein 3
LTAESGRLFVLGAFHARARRVNQEAKLMSFLGLFGRKRYERAGFALYTEAVRAARDPFFFAELGVPDTLDGRFDMVGLYVCLLIERLHREETLGRDLAQAVFDAMFLDMDGTLREMGVGDMSISKRVKAMWEAFHGRSQAYAAPLETADRAALANAIARNVWRGDTPALGADEILADTALRQFQHLKTQNLQQLLSGRVEFLPSTTVSA